ncbi:MAG: hypothetical protein NC243_11300 [Lachnoclostridium sp.]|nr:hypothetical protein [Lachnoclostridium sp.]MCM1385114.1 hypothetical protein [Lachnoclostridium sp.]
MHKLRENAEKELKAIEEKGLTSSNLDNAYKLVEIMKGVDKIEMMESGEYSNDGYSRDRGGRGGYSRDGGYSNDYDNGNSYRRGRNQRTGEYMHRPNYSRLSSDDTDMDEYRRRKSEYSNSRDGESKEKMLMALDDFMSGVCGMMKQLTKDADCREEREVIQNWCRKIAEI